MNRYLANGAGAARDDASQPAVGLELTREELDQVAGGQTLQHEPVHSKVGGGEAERLWETYLIIRQLNEAFNHLGM